MSVPVAVTACAPPVPLALGEEPGVNSCLCIREALANALDSQSAATSGVEALACPSLFPGKQDPGRC